MNKKIIIHPNNFTVKFENDKCEICESETCNMILHKVAEKYFDKGKKEGKKEAINFIKNIKIE